MPEINLIPQDLNPKDSHFLNIRYIRILILAVIFFLIIGGVFPMYKLKNINTREKSLRKEIITGEEVLKESEKLTKEIDVYKAYIVSVEKLLELLPDASDNIRGLEKYMVDNVYFISLTWKNGIITIRARSSSYNCLCTFVANLQESKEYSNARISEISCGQNEAEYSCVISIIY